MAKTWQHHPHRAGKPKRMTGSRALTSSASSSRMAVSKLVTMSWDSKNTSQPVGLIIGLKESLGWPPKVVYLQPKRDQPMVWYGYCPCSQLFSGMFETCQLVCRHKRWHGCTSGSTGEQTSSVKPNKHPHLLQTSLDFLDFAMTKNCRKRRECEDPLSPGAKVKVEVVSQNQKSSKASSCKPRPQLSAWAWFTRLTSRRFLKAGKTIKRRNTLHWLTLS